MHHIYKWPGSRNGNSLDRTCRYLPGGWEISLFDRRESKQEEECGGDFEVLLASPATLVLYDNGLLVYFQMPLFTYIRPAFLNN